jgi:hypothetical protein
MRPATRVMGSRWYVRVAVRLGVAAVAMLSGLALAPVAHAAPSASFEFSPRAPLTNEPVAFVSTSTGGTPPERWDLDGDLRCDDAVGPSVVRSFWPAGAYAVTLCISDGLDDATVTRRFTVHNRAPVAAVVFAPTAPMAGDTISLASTSADPDGPLVSLAWDLDADGAFDDAHGTTALVDFDAPGIHTIGLLVMDRDRATGVAVVDILVRARPPESISPFPLVRVAGSFSNAGIRIDQLTISAPEGARVEIRCRGRGCPFRKLVRRRGTQTVRVRRFARTVLRPGAVVQVWVTRPGEIGKYTRLRIRKGKRPTRVDRCLGPGSMRPMPCPR